MTPPGWSLNASATKRPTLRVTRERPAARREARVVLDGASGGRSSSAAESVGGGASSASPLRSGGGVLASTGVPTLVGAVENSPSSVSSNGRSSSLMPFSPTLLNTLRFAAMRIPCFLFG